MRSQSHVNLTGKKLSL